MIQRIQSIFLLVVISVLTIVSFWGNLFEIVTDEARFDFNGFGISKYTLDGKELISQTSIPVFVISLALALFALFILFSYKKLNTQFRYAKLLWGFYLLTLIGVAVWFYLIAPGQTNGKIIHSNYSAAFYILVIGLPFTYLAYAGIRKDKKTIDSLNRLR